MEGSPRRAELTPRGFRDVVGRFATGVTIMTTVTDDVHGMTVNAFSSVSLDPLLVLVCIERSAVMCKLVEESGIFALSILHEDAEDVAIHFADPYRPMGAMQFEGIPYRSEITGAPVLEGEVGWIDCRVWARHDGGDHVIIIGEVAGIGLGGQTAPLLFYRGAYRSMRPEGT